jgi:hypothetical protein
MAIKQLGVAPSATTDAATKDYVDTEVNAHAVMAIPFHVSGSLTTGVKTAEFIAPFAMTVTSMRGRCAAGSGATFQERRHGRRHHVGGHRYHGGDDGSVRQPGRWRPPHGERRERGH